MTIEEIEKRTEHIPSSIRLPAQELWLKHLTGRDIKTILDVGTGWAKSASTFGMICPSADIFTFDSAVDHINKGRTRHQYETQVLEYLAKAGVNNVHCSVAKAEDFEFNYPIDVLNVDAYPTETFITALKRFVPKVNKGGLIFCQCYQHPFYTDINDTVDDFVIKTKSMKKLDEAKTHGLSTGIVITAVFEKI